MSELEKICAGPLAFSEAAAAESKRRWDAIAKPLGSLGLLETAVTDIARLTGSADVKIDKRAVFVMCADNGVVREGVTQTGQEVTAIVAGKIAAGEGSVCHMAGKAGADVFAVDMGMASDVRGTIVRKTRRGTDNIAEGPAMTRADAESAVLAGIGLVREAKEQGYGIIVTGEMGIGNTTTSSAVLSAFLKIPPEKAAGRGAGLSDAGLERKISAIRRAIEINRPDENDVLDVLSKVGGLDICGMAGLFIGGAVYRIPVVIDGFISAVSALAAKKLCPCAEKAMLASHVSAEPAARAVLEALRKKPLICAEMRLGEGTGGVCLLPLLDLALAEYNGMSTFADVGVEAYTPQGGKG